MSETDWNDLRQYWCKSRKQWVEYPLPIEPSGPHFNLSGSKYLRKIHCVADGMADVYAVLEAFAVTCPARQHAIKKLLCCGIRGKGDASQDLHEARDAVDRAIQLEASRTGQTEAGQ